MASNVPCSLLLVALLVLYSSLRQTQLVRAINQEERVAPSAARDANDQPIGRRSASEQNYYEQQQQQQHQQPHALNNDSTAQKHGPNHKCARQSIILARQMLAHELNHLNQFNAFWFNDLDQDELIESQKHSLSNIVMSGASNSLLNSNGQPLIEIESSYFRQSSPASHHSGQSNRSAPPATTAPAGVTLRLLRKHQDRCHLNSERGHFSYTVGLSIGPIEHHLDVIYNLPKDLRLSQPIDWHYGQIAISVPRMHYEVSFRQAAHYRLDGGGSAPSQQQPVGHNQATCPLEISDLTYLPGGATSASTHSQHQQQQQQQQPASKHHVPNVSITSSGLALNNQTRVQIERLFDDYTRPAVSQRLRQMLKFYLNSKTFPLAAAAASN